MINECLFTGRVSIEPVINITNSGIKYMQFSIAINRQAKNSEVDFIRLKKWDNFDSIMQYLKKGTIISVYAKVKQYSYEQNGVIRKGFDFKATKIALISTK